MQLFRGISEDKLVKGCCLALGNFDGVHRGHRRLIKNVVQKARGKGRPAVVITFAPHPVQVLEARSPGLLTSIKRKAELIAALGVDYLFIIPFTKELAALEPETFVRSILWSHFQPQLVAVGFNFTFGCRGSGSPALLQKLGKELGYELEVMAPVTYKGVTVSSTVIRNALEQGDIELARTLLGYWPLLEGRVVAGDQRGRQLGFPTANLAIPAEMKLPACGVYACLARIQGGQVWEAMVNIGRHPTFTTALSTKVEAHLIDFKGDLYGQEMELELRAFLRPEHKFNSSKELIAKLVEDKNKTRLLLAGHN